MSAALTNSTTDKHNQSMSTEIKSLETVMNKKDSGEGQRENKFFYLKVKIKPQKRVKEETINVSQEYRATEGRRETPEG